jgi:hypothetical protein
MTKRSETFCIELLMKVELKGQLEEFMWAPEE